MAQMGYAFVADVQNNVSGGFNSGGSMYVSGVVLNSDDTAAYTIGMWVNFHYGAAITDLQRAVQAAFAKFYPGVTLQLIM